MNTRLKQFIAAENITQAQLADTIRVVRASVSHILAGRNKPSYEFISGLMLHYPELNMEWLMFGKGKMYKQSPSETLPEPKIELTDTPADEFGGLFADPSPESPREEPICPAQSQVSPAPPSIPEKAPSVPGVTLNDIKTLIDLSQKPVNQRKLVKITAFYDDGTFQELLA